MTNQASAQLNNPVELGLIKWHRSYDTAVEQSIIDNKPILILFQEVPGCSNCTKFGKEVLSHPLLVDAVENLFIPLAIFNNNKGEDAKILELFNEPSWNNPVVRIVDNNNGALAPRLHNNWSLSGLATSMVYALQNASIEVPKYLEILVDEFLAKENGMEEASFTMNCLWMGEATLAEVDGVINTLAGFVDGKYVIQLKYNPSVIAYEGLVRAAQHLNCTDEIFVNNKEQREILNNFETDFKISELKNFKIDNEPKYYLFKHPDLNKVPMTFNQAKVINSLLAKGKDIAGCLTECQLEILNTIKNNPNIAWQNMVEVPFLEAYQKMKKQLLQIN